MSVTERAMCDARSSSALRPSPPGAAVPPDPPRPYLPWPPRTEPAALCEDDEALDRLEVGEINFVTVVTKRFPDDLFGEIFVDLLDPSLRCSTKFKQFPLIDPIVFFLLINVDNKFIILKCAFLYVRISYSG